MKWPTRREERTVITIVCTLIANVEISQIVPSPRPADSAPHRMASRILRVTCFIGVPYKTQSLALLHLDSSYTNDIHHQPFVLVFV